MTLDKTQLTNMTTRQKAIAGAIVLVLVILLWLVIGMFKGGSKAPASKTANSSTSGPSNGPGGGAMTASSTPQPAQMTQQKMSSQQQSELIKLQQETQEKYVAALNELQMLKLSQQIAETNKDIAAAKLDTVKAEKGIVDLLTKPAPTVETPASFSPGLATPGGPLVIQPASPATPPGTSPIPGTSTVSSPTVVTTTTETTTTANYIVISVSQLLNKWSAVVGYQGKLYSIFVGDVLPPDQSTVIAIDKYSVILEKDGVQRKISLVPII